MIEETIPENVLFIPRGETEKTINFKGYSLKIKINILNNKENNELLKQHTYVDELEGSYDIDMVNLIEQRIVENLIDINTTFKGKKWTELTEDEKYKASNEMDPELREIINNEIIARNQLSDEEKNC